MNLPYNRQILTGASQHDTAGGSSMITLEAVQETTFEGKHLRKGERVRVSKSNAKRVLTISVGVFRTVVD